MRKYLLSDRLSIQVCAGGMDEMDGKEERFCFSKETPIVIYGCSESGIQIYRKMTASGYFVSNFIDCNAP